MRQRMLQCIDESMIRFKGRSSIKQFMPKKPIKRGYKVWVRDDKYGYICEFQIYTGKKKMKSNQWILRRQNYGAGTTLLRELVCEDYESYFNFLRIDDYMFQWLLNKVSPMIQRSKTLFRDPIPAELKLYICLRMLATGDSLASLQYLFRVPKSTISTFIPETFNAIYSALQSFIKVPRNEAEWTEIIRGFNYKRNFPNCIDAIDGKHIVIQCPPLSGSDYYNYKGTFSVVLLALVDDDYNFTCIDIGSYGSMSDGGIFSRSKLCKAVEENKLSIPVGSVVVGDEAFPLKTYLMKPFPRRIGLTVGEKIFNYRLCCARRIVENAFGILSSQFRIFRNYIHMKPSNVPKLVRTSCALHNWIRKSGRNKGTSSITADIEDTETGRILNGTWRTETT